MSEAESGSSRLRTRARLERKITAMEQATSAGDTSRHDELLNLKSELNKTSLFNSTFPLCLVSEIFNLVKETQNTTDFCSLPPPLLLGSVCKAWRETVWSDTRMWDTIIIRLSPTKFASQEQLLQDWLNRSGHYRPLSYYIHFISDDTKWKPPLSFAKLIIETSSRWQIFECSPNIPWLSGELQVPGRNFSSLSKLRIYHSPCFKLNFLTAPRLRHLVISMSLKMVQVTLLVNWSQLTTLEVLEEVEVLTAIEIVQKLKHVQCLSLHLTLSLSAVFQITPKTRELPYLTHLTLHTSQYPVVIPLLLETITSPALKQVEFIYGDPGCQWRNDIAYSPRVHRYLGETFENFFHRSSFGLERCKVSFQSGFWGMDLPKRLALVTNLSVTSVTQDRGYDIIDMRK